MKKESAWRRRRKKRKRKNGEGKRRKKVSYSLSLSLRRRRINPSPTRDLFHARPLDFIGPRTRFQGRMNVREMRRFPTKWRGNKLLHADKNSPLLSLHPAIYFFVSIIFSDHDTSLTKCTTHYFVNNNNNNISNDLTLNKIRSKKLGSRELHPIYVTQMNVPFD